LEQVDDNWLRGRLKNKVGLVPCQFVQHLPTINLDDNQSLYIAHTDYHSSHEEDLQFHRGRFLKKKKQIKILFIGDLLIVHEHLPNDWFRGSLHFNLPGTTFRPIGIFPKTFVTLVKEKSKNTNQNGIIYHEKKKLNIKILLYSYRNSGIF